MQNIVSVIASRLKDGVAIFTRKKSGLFKFPFQSKRLPRLDCSSSLAMTVMDKFALRAKSEFRRSFSLFFRQPE
ncbi:MAG: hypothetical protein IJV35_00350 [Neisseriaceae bacterium]|nr:hypothetical protein [Neisseriaceae bacterium]